MLPSITLSRLINFPEESGTLLLIKNTPQMAYADKCNVRNVRKWFLEACHMPFVFSRCSKQ
jgi:hypothetical protein